MIGKNRSRSYEVHSHQGRAYEPHLQDPYQTREKWSEPMHCASCGAIYHKGKWAWGDMAEGSTEHQCPACARVMDKVPAGFLSVSGEFMDAHKDEILSLIKNIEQREKLEHPLERIMRIEENQDGISISFTGVHLTQGAGKALHDAYQGELKTNYSESDAQVRVYWQR